MKIGYPIISDGGGGGGGRDRNLLGCQWKGYLVVFLEAKGEEFGLDSKDDDVVPKVEDVVLEGAFSGEGDEDCDMGEGLDEEAWVDAMDVLRFKGKE
ncbi:hypothetical protein Tco_1368503 [Tanacetum coccineum]